MNSHGAAPIWESGSRLSSCLQTCLQHQSALFSLPQRPAVAPGPQPAADARLEQDDPLRSLLHHQVQVLHVVVLEENLEEKTHQALR